MADAKITALDWNYDPRTDDIVALVDDPDGTPSTQKTSLEFLKGAIVGVVVVQTSHPFYAGDVIRVSGANTYAKAKADTSANAEVVGVVNSYIDVDTFSYIPAGFIATGWVPAVAAGTVLFLSDATAGLLTSTVPTTTGHVIKPVAVVLENAASMIVFNWRGVVISNPYRPFEFKVIADTAILATGDGQLIFCIPSELNGFNLVDVDAFVTTVSSSGLPTIQLRNVTDSVDMLTVKCSIDATEYTSYTATTGITVDTTHDDVATGDLIAIDVDVAGTGAKGLGVIIVFQLP